MNILVDKDVDDKNRDLFVKAVLKEAEAQEVHANVIKVTKDYIYDGYEYMNSTLIAEPFKKNKPFLFNDADRNATAKVISNILAGYEKKTVLIINRSELIGIPLILDLLRNQNHTLMIAHSQTSETDLKWMMSMADILVTATGHKLEISGGSFDCIIDVSNDIVNSTKPICSCQIYNQKDIGKLTVKQIIKNVKGAETRW